jgi:hypothetical protein
MIVYYQTYRRGQEGKNPTGIFVKGTGGHAILWDQRQKAWVYDPEWIAQYTFKAENQDRYDLIPREQAEALMLTITEGKEALPDEETILWIFQWKGAPPQSEE